MPLDDRQRRQTRHRRRLSAADKIEFRGRLPVPGTLPGTEPEASKPKGRPHQQPQRQQKLNSPKKNHLFPTIFHRTHSFKNRHSSSTISSSSSSTPKRWAFIHIPKTSGESFMHDSPNHMPVTATLKGNWELSYGATLQNRRGEPLVVVLRHPTAHVLSQFLECKYDGWGQSVTNGTGFPGYQQLDRVLQGFDEWIRHFQIHAQHPDANTTQKQKQPKPLLAHSQHYGARVAYNCYDPFNMMSRYLTIMEPRYYNIQPHVAMKFNHRFPNITVAIQNLKAIQVVGILEYYSATLCLFEYHAGGKQFLTQGCQQCDYEKQQLIMGKKHTHATHGVPPHSVSMISNETRMIIEGNMTRIDQQLYQAALELFFQEIDQVWNATGIDLLCRPERQIRSNATIYHHDGINQIHHATPHLHTVTSQPFSTTSRTYHSLELSSLLLSMFGLLGVVVFVLAAGTSSCCYQHRCHRQHRQRRWTIAPREEKR